MHSAFSLLSDLALSVQLRSSNCHTSEHVTRATSGMEIAGLVAGVIPLVTMAKDLYNSIQRLRLNPERRRSLTKLVEDLIAKVGTASARSSAAEELVRSSLEDVTSTLKSLVPEARKMGGLRKYVLGCTAAPGEADKLDEVEKKLESLITQVVVVKSVFQLQEELPRVRNEKMELPDCIVGLGRAETVLDFLQRSAGEELRVVGIHGLPGLGKSTLLNYVWNKASSKAPFAARAHIQAGQSINDMQICTLQSIILQQLGGERNAQFTAPEGGRGTLSEHLQQLKQDRKPIFLAIDNVFELEHLTKLLPATLSKDIPAFSVIALTSRRLTVVKDLLNMCRLHQDNGSQVYLLNPDLLSLVESKAVFATCGGLSDDADAELLKSLVPLCGGLPLALTVLGKLFAGNARRSRKEWELIKEQMEKLDGGDTETRPVTNALQVSYDQLHESRKVAFCDVVKCFYGWNWERVERILGVGVLTDLKESSLVSEASDWSKCNQNALREGFDQDVWSHIGERRAVTMHDLTLKFGEGLHTEPLVMTRTDFRSMRGLLQHLEAPKLRDLILCIDSVEGDLEPDQFLEKAASLRTLFLCDFRVRRGGWRISIRNSVLKASICTNNLCMEWRPLRFLRLEGWKSSQIIIEMMLSSEIREIHLSECQDVEQLPDTSLHKLEVLRIWDCENFQYFSPSSVGKWCKLKILHVECCNRLTSVPAELGCLENLSDLRIDDCPNLQALPTMSCPLQRLHLANLPIAKVNLEETANSCLRNLVLRGCENIKELPDEVGKLTALTELDLGECSSLVELPDEVGKLVALTELCLNGCSGLKALPPAIGNASSLRRLQLGGCRSLVELPDEVGKLATLTELHIAGCSGLKALPLAIGNASSLRRLDLGGCESLVELPDEVGKLVALTELRLGGCSGVKALLPGIGNASSLRTLDLRGCRSLVELPDEVGKLAALTELRLWGCSGLKALSPGIGNASSLRTLDLGGCASLAELPDEVGKLAALTELRLRGCSGLKALPRGIGNASSLRTLVLGGCGSLVELPDEVGKLAALTELRLIGCSGLKAVPPAIGNASRLQTLVLGGCRSLVELPDEVGELVALTELCLEGCSGLKALPSVIGNTSSLWRLDLGGCASLVELPDEVGKLAALTELRLRGCSGLKALPPAIGNASSLRTLDLWGCASLVELPDEVGKLAALTELCLIGCSGLKALPPAITNASVRTLLLRGWRG